MSPNESNHRAVQCIHAARTAAASRISMSIVAAALLAISAPLAAGCATGTTAPQEEPTGQLVFPLVQPGPDGALYRLSNAFFDITSLTTGVTATVDGSGN
jgi:hypothetical protein